MMVSILNTLNRVTSASDMRSDFLSTSGYISFLLGNVLPIFKGSLLLVYPLYKIPEHQDM